MTNRPHDEDQQMEDHQNSHSGVKGKNGYTVLPRPNDLVVRLRIDGLAIKRIPSPAHGLMTRSPMQYCMTLTCAVSAKVTLTITISQGDKSRPHWRTHLKSERRSLFLSRNTTNYTPSTRSVLSKAGRCLMKSKVSTPITMPHGISLES